MTTIVALCPYCRAGGVRAPASAVGASANCPKCGSSFTVLPSEGLPGWAKEPQASAPTQPANAPPATETRPAAALADVTEPSPVMPADPLARPKAEKAKGKARKAEAEPKPTPVSKPDEPDEPSEPSDFGMMIALAACTLVGVAVLASQLPFGRFIAAGIAVVGLLGGLASLGAEGRAKMAAASAVFLHLLILVIVFLAPSVLDLDPWRKPVETGPQGPQAIAHADQTSTPAEWVDAATASWQFKDVRVSVTSAFIGPVEIHGPKDAKRTTKEQYFQIQLRVTNSGVERQIDLTQWAIGQGADAIRVTDPAGKSLKIATFENGWSLERGKPSERLFPGKWSEAKFFFTVPAAKADFFRVQLPGTAFGMPDETVKFQIGGGLLARSGSPTP